MKPNAFQLMLGAGLWLAAGHSIHAQGTIRYVDNFNKGFAPIPEAYEWDINDDGTIDFVISYTGRDFEIYPEEGNFVIGIPEPPPNIGSLVIPLNPWDPIGDFDYSPAEWSPTLIFNNGESRIGVLFNACVAGGCYGFFNNLEAPFGFQFEAEDGTHYGWANLKALNHNFFSGGVITDYAYNTMPDGMILAGQVPEPSTWMLLVGGAGLLWYRLKRSRNNG